MKTKLALVGNPNSGKSTLFNALTGAQQQVGNWSGVTVEQKQGEFTHAKHVYTLIDLPGIYSLSMHTEMALDEKIACQFLFTNPVDVIVNVVNASQLERHLYLTLQLLELNVPVVIALNMTDVAAAQQRQVDARQLSRELGCTVIDLQAHRGLGIDNLTEAITASQADPVQALSRQTNVSYPDAIIAACDTIAAAVTLPQPQLAATTLGMQLLENHQPALLQTDAGLVQVVTHERAAIQRVTGEEVDLLIASARYQAASDITAKVQQRQQSQTWTERIDQVVLHRFWGVPIFFVVIYAVFFFSINVGGALQDFFDITGQSLFVDGVAHLLYILHAPNWLIALLACGVGIGITTTLTFVPVMAALFFSLALLETSGYMARAAFVMDRVMVTIGLPGKAFVPLIVGFGCNVPAIMGTRTLEHYRDRILAAIMSPFMSCGARLAIYVIFAAAFFPANGANIIFSLYLVGIGIAVLTGWVLRKTLLQGESSRLIMELPAYHAPHLGMLAREAGQRLYGFVTRAGRVILVVCVLLASLNALQLPTAEPMSLLAFLGHQLTPIFVPMGISTDNWPATVSILTGTLAKEVVIATLNSLYGQVDQLQFLHAQQFHFIASLQAALASIADNFHSLQQALFNPVAASAPNETMTISAYRQMQQHFAGPVAAYAYLLFVLLYSPCVTAIAAIWRELGRAWAIFSVLWSTVIAYGTAVIFYQLMTFQQHPLVTLVWIAGLALLLTAAVTVMRRYCRDTGPTRSVVEIAIPISSIKPRSAL